VLLEASTVFTASYPRVIVLSHDLKIHQKTGKKSQPAWRVGIFSVLFGKLGKTLKPMLPLQIAGISLALY